MPILIKTLKLSLDASDVECQLTQAELADSPSTEEVTTFCGTETSATPNYKLNIGGFQDWGDVAAVTDLIHTAYQSDTEMDFVLTVGSKTRTGTAKATADVPFGGNAGSALTFTTVLDVIGTPTDGDAV